MERNSKMLRTVDKAKVQELKSQWKKIVFTTLWVILLGAGLAFMAIAGHV